MASINIPLLIGMEPSSFRKLLLYIKISDIFFIIFENIMIFMRDFTCMHSQKATNIQK